MACLIFSQNNEKYLRMPSAAVVIGTFRVNNAGMAELSNYLGPTWHCYIKIFEENKSQQISTDILRVLLSHKA